MAERHASRILAWISAAGADAIGRIVLQIGATALFARWLETEDFGRASLAIVLIGILSVLVTGLFEEALVQRKRVRKIHFSSALFVAFGLAILGIGTAQLIGLASSNDAEIGRIAGLLAVLSLLLIADAPVAIYTALARRHKRFHVIAGSKFAGQLCGTLVGLSMAFVGFGVWSLLAVRLVDRYVILVSMVWRARVRVLPAFSGTHLHELSTFAGWFFAGSVVDRVSAAAFQSLVTYYFGVTGNGYLNIAMRIVEPIQGAVSAIGHNIAMFFFTRSQDSDDRLKQSLAETMAGVSMAFLPVYLGLAAVADGLVALLAGPGWEPAVPLVVYFAIAAAISCPLDYLYTAMTSRGRADLGFAASVLELVLTCAALSLLATEGLSSIGLSRVIVWAGVGIFAMAAARRLIGFSYSQNLRSFGPPVVSSAVMAMLVAMLGRWAPLQGLSGLRLCMQVVAGIAIYGVLVWTFQRAVAVALLNRLRRPQ